MSRLEQRYRRLLRLLPGWYRAVWEQDMVTTFLAGVEDVAAGSETADLVAEYGWPDRAEVASVLGLAVRLRLGGAPDHPRSQAWGAAARRVALVVLLVNAALNAMFVAVSVWLSGAVPGIPDPRPDLLYTPSPGEWMLIVAGVVWPAAYLALVAGHPRAAAALATAGLGHDALVRVGAPLTNDGPIEAAAAAAAAVGVLVLALLLLSLAAFQPGTPPPPRRPWLAAFGVGLAVSPALPMLWFHTPPDPLAAILTDPDAVSCLLVVLAGTAYLARRAVQADCEPAWPLALAVLSAAALTLRLTSLWAFTHNLTAPERLAPLTAGLIQVGAALTVATALTVIAAHDLRRLPMPSTHNTIRP